MWTLDEALIFIRKYQPLSAIHGYNLSLGGGVLNNGHSNHDLDIVCCPAKDKQADPLWLREILNRWLGMFFVRQWNPTMDLYRTTLPDGRIVEWFFVNMIHA